MKCPVTDQDLIQHEHRAFPVFSGKAYSKTKIPTQVVK
jgi:hypothetical protein